MDQPFTWGDYYFATLAPVVLGMLAGLVASLLFAVQRFGTCQRCGRRRYFSRRRVEPFGSHWRCAFCDEQP